MNGSCADFNTEPIIDRAFPLEQIAAAHRYVETNVRRGRIVVTT